MSFSSRSAATIRLMLSGQQRVMAGLAATKAEVSSLKRSVVEYGEATQVATKRSWAMNQALFTLRRYAYMSTLALSGAGLLALKWGYNFNSAMQSAATALQPVMKGSGAIRSELGELFQMAKYSPFQFKDLTIAFRSMYLAMQPLGISAHTVNVTIQSLIDALSATGRTSPSQLNRVSVALQHMAYQGRLTGYTVNQLAKDGIPIFGALNKELGISGDQLHNISKMGISSAQVLDAINRYIESTPGYMHAAWRQAQTLHGQLTTLRDNISQVMGALTLGGFKRTTTGILPAINHMFDDISKIIIKQQGRIKLGQIFKVAEVHFPWIKNFITMIKDLIDVLKILWNVFRYGVLPVIVIFAWWFDKLNFIIHPVLMTLKFLTKQMWLMVPILSILIGLYTLDRLVLWKTALAQKELADMTWLEATVSKKTWTMQRIQTYWTAALGFATRLLSALTKGYIRNAEGQFVAMSRLEKMVATLGRTIRLRLIPAITAWIAEQTGLDIALWPLAVIAAIIALIATIALLYWKWKWFHDLVNRTATWLWKHWVVLTALLLVMFGAMALIPVIIIAIIKNWNTFKGYVNDVYKIVLDVVDVFKSIWNWIMKIIDAVKSWIHWMAKLLPWNWGGSPGTGPGSAAIRTAIGYNGPGFPLAPAPAGGGVLPPGMGGSAIAGSIIRGRAHTGHLNVTVHSHVHVDGKKVAESVAKHRQNMVARK